MHQSGRITSLVVGVQLVFDAVFVIQGFAVTTLHPRHLLHVAQPRFADVPAATQTAAYIAYTAPLLPFFVLAAWPRADPSTRYCNARTVHAALLRVIDWTLATRLVLFAYFALWASGIISGAALTTLGAGTTSVNLVFALHACVTTFTTLMNGREKCVVNCFAVRARAPTPAPA